MQTDGICRHRVDWDAVRKEAFLRAQHAQTAAEMYGAIRYVLRKAWAQHSFFMPPSSAAVAASPTAPLEIGFEGRPAL